MNPEAKSQVIRLRVSRSELELLQAVARSMNRPACNFIRWAAVEAAKQASAQLPRGAEVPHD